jgi:hypothetical protein
MRRLPPEVIVARNQRLKRAMDLSLKHEKLPKELRDKQTPFDHYLLVSQHGDSLDSCPTQPVGALRPCMLLWPCVHDTI